MENQILECECGGCHELNCKNVVVSNKAFKALLEKIKSCEHKNILILNSLEQPIYIDRIISELRETDKTVSVVSLPKCNAFLKLAEQIEDKGQDVVVAIGSEELISIAKYYSFCYASELYIFPIGNFTDYTFSKFSRLCDGVSYDFYSCQEPAQIFVSNRTNKYNKYQSSYIISKYLAFFDNEVNCILFEQNSCPRMYDFFKQALGDYIKEKSVELEKINNKNIWFLIRIGLAMTFFEQTNYFLSADYYITSLTQSIYKRADYLELSTISQKLIINSYSCFVEQIPSNYDFNLNKHIFVGSQVLKITSTEVMNRMAGGIKLDKSCFNKFNNYFVYLKETYTKTLSKIFTLNSVFCLNENIMLKYRLDAVKLEKLFAVGACFSKKQGLYSLILNCGYLDKLL